jgi:hypothetical protein
MVALGLLGITALQYTSPTLVIQVMYQEVEVLEVEPAVVEVVVEVQEEEEEEVVSLIQYLIQNLIPPHHYLAAVIQSL